jgi:hypothetical protein
MKISLAQVGSLERRHPDEILLDSLHLHDVGTREFLTRLVAQLQAGEEVAPDEVDRLIAMNQMRHHMAATTITSKAYEKVSVAYTRHLEAEGQLVAIAFDAIVRGLTRSLDPQHGEQLHAWALGQAHRVLTAAQPGETTEVSDVEPPPFALAAVTGTGDAVRRRDHNVVDDVSPYEAGSIVPCDVAVLDDQALRSLGEAVLAELERRDLAT